MPVLLTFLFRLFLVAAGLVFAASLAVSATLLAAIWCTRAAWAKLTGRPVMPFIIRIDPRAGFGQVYRYRAAAQRSRTPRADAVQSQRGGRDVTDVEPR